MNPPFGLVLPFVAFKPSFKMNGLGMHPIKIMEKAKSKTTTK